MSATPNMTFAHSVSMNISYIQIANSKKKNIISRFRYKIDIFKEGIFYNINYNIILQFHALYIYSVTIYHTDGYVHSITC